MRPLRIRIFSDLHIEQGRYHAAFEKHCGEDMVILAGDIDVGTAGIDWAARRFPGRPVVYVLGNHEYYHQDFRDLTERCRAAARGTQVVVLENDAFDYGGIRFLGATLWTDFAVLGDTRTRHSMYKAEREMDDYSVIRDGRGSLRPQRTIERHVESRQWLQSHIRTSDVPLVVVTHHAPTIRSMHPGFVGDLKAAAFYSDCEDLMRPPVRLWVHGHTHHNVDLHVNGVHVLTNQWGYAEHEAQGFRFDCVVEVER